MQEETDLVKEAIRGNSRSLAELLHRNYTFLFQYVLKITMDKSRAEDVTQETMLRAIEKINTFNAKAKFSTWLITIASRLIIDKSRRSKLERQWLQKEQLLTVHTSKSDLLGNNEQWQVAVDALAQLGESHRIPILLKYYYGYSQEEISIMINVPVGTVKSRLHSGLKHLRKELTEGEEKKR